MFWREIQGCGGTTICYKEIMGVIYGFSQPFWQKCCQLDWKGRSQDKMKGRALRLLRFSGQAERAVQFWTPTILPEKGRVILKVVRNLAGCHWHFRPRQHSLRGWGSLCWFHRVKLAQGHRGGAATLRGWHYPCFWGQQVGPPPPGCAQRTEP